MLSASGRSEESFFELAGMQDKRKGPSGRSRRALSSANSKRSVFRRRLRSSRLCGHFRFRAAQPPHGVCANAPEDRELRFLGLAVLAFALRADQLSVNEDTVALATRNLKRKRFFQVSLPGLREVQAKQRADNNANAKPN
jgi:hypothetical protein